DDNNVRLGDRWTIAATHTEVIIGPLCPHPECESSELSATWINVDAVQIILAYEPGERMPQVFNGRVVVLEPATGRLRVRTEVILPPFFGNVDQQIESVQQEVA